MLDWVRLSSKIERNRTRADIFRFDCVRISNPIVRLSSIGFDYLRRDRIHGNVFFFLTYFIFQGQPIPNIMFAREVARLGLLIDRNLFNFVFGRG